MLAIKGMLPDLYAQSSPKSNGLNFLMEHAKSGPKSKGLHVLIRTSDIKCTFGDSRVIKQTSVMTTAGASWADSPACEAAGGACASWPCVQVKEACASCAKCIKEPVAKVSCEVKPLCQMVCKHKPPVCLCIGTILICVQVIYLCTYIGTTPPPGRLAPYPFTCKLDPPKVASSPYLQTWPPLFQLVE